MIKSELSDQIAAKMPQLSEKCITQGINHILITMEEALQASQHIEIRGFGSFTLRHFAERESQNPKTGEKFMLPAGKKIHFKPGKNLRERLNVIQDNK
jgi:integration host factor subunit beta